MKLLNENDFDLEINKSNLTVVDFYADWCGPCKMLSPFLEQLSQQYTDVNWDKIDVDESQSLAARFSVSSIPTVIFFKDGKEVARSVGFKPISEFERLIEETKNS